MCDNASNNDTMIDRLGNNLPSFDGPRSRVRCFAHVLNLAAKVLLRQFDVSKGKEGEMDTAIEAELHELMVGVDLEDVEEEWTAEDKEMGAVDDDGLEMPDLVDFLSDDELDELVTEVQPTKLVLAKARL